MGVRRLEDIGQVLVHVDATGDEAGAGTEREGAGTGRAVDRSERRRRRARADPAGRRILAFRKAVYLIVEKQYLAVEVAAEHVHRMVAADRQRIAVAGDDPHVELGIGELDAGREGRCAAVDGVEAVGLHVVGETRRAADAGDEHDILRPNAELRHRPLNRLQHGIVAAAGAPAHLLVGREILRSELHHFVHASASSMAASISAILKGWPLTLFTGLASTRYWSRSRVLSWPLFISGTMIRS